MQPQIDEKAMLRRFRARRRLRRMLAVRGVALDGAWWRGFEEMIIAALDQCASCPDAGECDAWLATHAASALPPAFCANGRAIEACRIIAGGG